MAARANLSIGAKLKEEFLAATGGSDIRPRFVQCRVADETVEFVAKGTASADFAADLAAVRSTALSGKATFVLLHLDGVSASLSWCPRPRRCALAAGGLGSTAALLSLRRAAFGWTAAPIRSRTPDPASHDRSLAPSLAAP